MCPDVLGFETEFDRADISGGRTEFVARSSRGYGPQCAFHIDGVDGRIIICVGI